MTAHDRTLPSPSSWPWLGTLPAMRNELHFGDRELRCFAERPRSVYALLERAAATFPEREALVDGARRWRWRELQFEVTRVAAGMVQHGVAPGERVLLMLRNRAEFVVALFALARIGAIAVPLSVRSAPPEVHFVAAQCGAVAAIVEDDLLEHLAAVAGGLRWHATMSGQGESLPWPALHADTGDSAATPVHEDDTAVILYTSGTTGRPKGAMLAHFNIVHSAMHYEACMGLTAQDRSVLAVPLSHVTGLVAQAYTTAHCGAALVLMDAFKAEAFLQLAAREAITHTVMVPAMYQLCLLQSDVTQHDLSAWRIGAYVGAPMASATIAALAERLPGLILLNCYGATETTSPATIMPPGFTAKRPDSVGVAVPCGEISVRSATGQAQLAGESGELWIRGPMVVKGYWDNASATASEFSDGWWHSGDLGRIDEQGFVEVLDRIKDLINRGGYKVFSSEVEAVLLQHPAVVEAAVVGFACPVLGERVQAFVCLRHEASSDELQAHCAKNLADYKVPERWHLGFDALPRNANGKLVKRALRASVGL